MGSAVRKTTLREIRGTFGRFFAIMAIIALGVGFFTGVRITTPAMVDTVNRFLEEKQLYDYRLISSLGWQEEDIADFKSRHDVRAAEGSYTLDILTAGTNEYVFRAHSITENINGIRLTEGRMPQAPDECIIDDSAIPTTVYVLLLSAFFTLSEFSSERVKVVPTGNLSLFLSIIHSSGA